MSNGKRFFPGWPVGAEVAGPNGQSGWIGQAVHAANGSGAWTSYGFNFQRYMVPWVKSASGEMDEARAFSQFDIDKDPPRLEELRQILDATDPDLSAFRKHGGKLLMYFGWADPQLNAKMGVEYYEQVVDKMGPSTDEFFRLFMVPGMFHCGGGVGTSQFEMTTPVVKWVEAGTAPVRIEASRVSGGKVVRSARIRKPRGTRVRAASTTRRTSHARNRSSERRVASLINRQERTFRSGGCGQDRWRML
jgi:feruloyl esterase